MSADLHGRAVSPVDSDDVLDVVACPVCDATRATPRFAVEGMRSRIVVCPGCGLGRFHPMPGPDQIASFYTDEYYGTPTGKVEGLVELAVRLVGSRHVHFLSRGLPRGARVLDVGCGRGVLLAALADRGFEVHGIEISETAARGADPRARIRITPDLARAGYPAGFFDQVIVWHVLEHLPDPAATLAEIHRILRPGGMLVVAVPNFSSLQSRWAGADWFHLDAPRHLYHFPLGALLRLLRRQEFAPRAVHHFSLRQNPFGWLQSALNRRRHLPRNALYVLLHRRAAGNPAPFDRATRFRLRLAYWLGMPIALALTGLETALRSGATVHVVAEKARSAQGSTVAA